MESFNLVRFRLKTTTLKEIDSSIKINNLITGIETYKINKQTKSLKSLIIMNLLFELLDNVIDSEFKTIDFDFKGRLEWKPATQKQKEKHFKRRGKDLTSQRRSYKLNKEFRVKPKSKKEISSLNYHQILISDIEEDGVFYCIIDFRTIRNMGHKNRYKFKILNYNQPINISDVQFELLDKEMIMIR